MKLPYREVLLLEAKLDTSIDKEDSEQWSKWWKSLCKVYLKEDLYTKVLSRTKDNQEALDKHKVNILLCKNFFFHYFPFIHVLFVSLSFVLHSCCRKTSWKGLSNSKRIENFIGRAVVSKAQIFTKKRTNKKRQIILYIVRINNPLWLRNSHFLVLL